MSTESKKRVAAIVGRPNVGKSALFNRLIRKRIAIVHEESGVTRDRLSSEVLHEEERFDLIDTGGLGMLDKAHPDHIFDQGIVDQIDAAIKDAAVLIFVVDITAGITPLDEQVALNLRRAGLPVLLAVNKSDNDRVENDVGDFDALGLPSFPVSALHNRGISDLLDAVVAELPEAVPKEETEALRVVVVGKPNVGKSSYINRLLNSDRVIVSEIPGTTRDSIAIPFTMGSGAQARHYEFIDTAGMRQKRKATEAVEKFSIMRAEKSIARADVVVHVLDGTTGATRQDKKIASIIEEEKKGYLLLVNKWDLVEETERAYGPNLKVSLPFLGHVPVLFMSTKSGYNIRKTIDAIDFVSEQVSKEIGTGVLNRSLQEIFQRRQPPIVKNGRLKLFYATQVSTRPVIFKLFVNNAKHVKSAYKAYLVNALRKAFGFEGAPVILSFTARKREERIH